MMILRPSALAPLLAAVALAGCSANPHRVDVAAAAAPEPPAPQAAQAAEPDALAERVAYGSWGRTKLPPDFLLRSLRSRDRSSALAAAFERLRADETPTHRDALLREAERGFVHAADTSSLDLLGTELSTRFRSFHWAEDDYPGGAGGPNEPWAETLADALDAVTPERRANRSDVAAIRREEATDALWESILGQWRPVPGEEGHRLNRHAIPAFVAMREAAAADGVGLVILSAHRDPERARAMADAAGNAFAVASFSSHSLGLAVDFVLPRPEGDASADADADDPDPSEGDGSAGRRFRLTTRPMSAVVDMRRSPVHKWLHLHAAAFGWYPFQHEPWHWEYNPPGFRGVFWSDLDAVDPAAAPAP